jgi:hypothetical protein
VRIDEEANEAVALDAVTCDEVLRVRLP